MIIRVKSLKPPALYLIISFLNFSSVFIAVITILYATAWGKWLVSASIWSCSSILINFTLLPKNSQNFFNFSIFSFFGFLSSQIIVHLFLNKSLKPAEGPLSSVPAIGWDAIQEILARFKFSNILFTSFLLIQCL